MWSMLAAPTRATPARRSARWRNTARSSCRTRPAIRASTSTNITMEAAITTTVSESCHSFSSRITGAIRQATVRNASRTGVSRVRPSAGCSSVRIEGCSAAAPQSR